MKSSKMNDRINADDADCGGCPLIPERREFFRRGAALAIGAIALGLPIRTATAKVLSAGLGGKTLLTYPVPAADGAEIDHENEVILVREKSEVYAFNLSCPHQHTALRWNETDLRFQCPRHHSQYQPDGEFITGRATRNMDRFAVTRNASNMIVVDLDTLYQSDDDEAQWKAAVVKL
jgi:nitrite reductase/ring-hydroxylating ferredoxin subunit